MSAHSMSMKMEFETGHQRPTLLGSKDRRGETIRLDDEGVFVRGSGNKGDPFVVDLYTIPEEVRYLHFTPEGQAIDPLSPCRIESDNYEEDGFALLMPRRL